MDWLINPLNISILAGFFTLAIWVKRKNIDEVSSKISSKRNYEPQQKDQKNEIETLEQRAKQIIKQDLSTSSDSPPYEEVKNLHGFTGFMEFYLQQTKNNQTMSNTANYDTMFELASIDKFRDRNTFCKL